MGGRGGNYYTKKDAEGVMNAMRDAGLPVKVSVEQAQKILNRDTHKMLFGLKQENSPIGNIVNESQLRNYEKQYNQTETEASKKVFNTEKENLMKRIGNNTKTAKTFIANKQKTYDSQIRDIHKQMGKPSITENEYQRLLKKANTLTAKRTAAYLINSSMK